MAGRQQWETVVASATRQSLVVTTNSFPGQVIAAGQNFTIDIFAPAGTIGKFQNMYMFVNAVPTGATTGDQSVVLTTTVQAGGFIAANVPKEKSIAFNRFHFIDFTTQEPADTAGVVSALKDACFDSAVGLRLIITNNTNATLTGTIAWNVTWLKIEAA